MRNQFTFYKSFDDVIEDLSDKQIAEYIKVMLDVQFLRVKIDDVEFTDKTLSIVWKSQKHSISTSIKGYLDGQKRDTVKNPYLGVYDNSLDPALGVRQQEKEEVQGKEEEKEEEEVKEKEEEEVKDKDKVNKQCIINKGTEEVYLDCNEADELFVEYLSLRKKMKLSNSKTVITRLINKLEDFSRKGHSSIDVISNAIIGSWKDFYEPKQTNQPRSFKQQENDSIDQSVENYYRMKENGFDLQEELIKQSQRDNQQGRHNELN